MCLCAFSSVINSVLRSDFLSYPLALSLPPLLRHERSGGPFVMSWSRLVSTAIATSHHYIRYPQCLAPSWPFTQIRRGGGGGGSAGPRSLSPRSVLPSANALMHRSLLTDSDTQRDCVCVYVGGMFVCACVCVCVCLCVRVFGVWMLFGV